MKKKSGNVAPSFRHPSAQVLGKALSDDLLQKHLCFEPNHFLTVRLYGAAEQRSPSWLNTNERSAQLLAGKRIVRQLDEAVYGSSLKRLWVKSRFPFFMRLETVSKYGVECAGHFHILFKLNLIEETHYLKRYPRMRPAILKSLTKLGFAPDFMPQEHDGQKTDYLTKYADKDVLNFFTRDYPIKA